MALTESELRQTLFRMSVEELEVLNEALDKGDGETVCAIIRRYCDDPDPVPVVREVFGC